uniref:Uncharacterized protein n=1 Tax=Avena sativa TaxID=4498 RepID=A0ACD5ZLH2_AVESA
MQVAAAAGRRRREDRLSTLSDDTLGRILSFLPAKEAARASVLSSRWRDTYAGVDAVSLDEQDRPFPGDPHPTPPFTTAITAALLARHNAPDPPPPLRVLRAVLNHYRHGDASAVDHWVSYAIKHAAPAHAGLEIDLRLRRAPLCSRRYSLRASEDVKEHGARLGRKRSRSPDPDPDEEEEERKQSNRRRTSDSGPDTDSEPDSHAPPEYTVPGRLFSCNALRSLSLGPCRLSPPDAVSLPYLEALVLTRVSDHERHVQRLIAACPRLAELTLEACGTITALYLLGNHRLRSLALRCCHSLAVVAVNGGMLRSLEYRGAAPVLSLSRGGGGQESFASCMVDVCGEEVSSAKDLAKLGEFLQLLASTKHLHLQSARLGCGIEHDALATSLPMFTSLLHLELTGQLPHCDGDAAIAAVSTILWRAPCLEVISLAFAPGPGNDELLARQSCRKDCKRGELAAAHQLRYNELEVLAATPAVRIPCLRSRVREIKLVHYHGGMAQRTLAKFLLCNAPVLDRLYCGFAPGPSWIQNKLRDEIQGWAMNKAENRIFD